MSEGEDRLDRLFETGRANARPPDAAFDRQLVDLISTLTDESLVEPLRSVVNYSGKELTARVIRDGFAGVLRAALDEDFHDVLGEELREMRFLPTEEALRIVGLKRISLDYHVAQKPGAIGLEDDAGLIFRYAADDPDAIAEVRARHAEGWERWRKKCR